MAVLEESRLRQSPLVTLAGEVDSHGSARMTDVLKELLDAGCSAPRVDLAGVSFIDSEGLLALLHWCRQFEGGDGEPKFVSVNPIVRRLFEVSGFEHFISCSEDHGLPVQLDRQPITDCMASAEDWEVRSFTVPARLECCKVVRDRITQTVSTMPFTQEERMDIRLAVGETISNAIRHGCGERPWERITVRSLATPHALVVEISDPGTGFELDAELVNQQEQASPREGRMGIGCMLQSMDEVSFDFTQGTTVRLVKYVKPSVQ